MDTQGDEPSSVAVVGGAGGGGGGTPHGTNNATRKRFAFARVVPEQGKKRVNYGKGDARRIMEEAVSLCEAMTLGYEVVFHGRRRSFAGKSGSISDGVRYTHTKKTQPKLLWVHIAHCCCTLVRESALFVLFLVHHRAIIPVIPFYLFTFLSQTARAKTSHATQCAHDRLHPRRGRLHRLSNRAAQRCTTIRVREREE